MPIREYALVLAAGWRSCLACWNPRPLAEPLPPVGLELQSFPVRACRCVEYAFLKIEYAISRGGRLREWLKLNLLVAVTLAVPALLILPQACLLASTLSLFAISMEQAMIATFHAILYGLGSIGLLTAAGLLTRGMLCRR